MQYLDPRAVSGAFAPALSVQRYVTPEEFEEYEKIGHSMGFSFVASGSFVRSSYHAVKMLPVVRPPAHRAGLAGSAPGQ